MDKREEYLRKRVKERMTGVPMRLREYPKSRVWFYKPSFYWFGWSTLVPVSFGHDEYSRNTLMLGWIVTGRIVVALGYCGDAECYEQSLRWIDYEDDID